MRGLDRSDSGVYTVLVKNSVGEISADVTLIVQDKPSAPQSLTVTNVTEDSISLAWKPPADDGGSKVTRYVIEGRLGNKRSWQQFGRTSNLEFTVSRLQEGEKYYFQVMAENSIGVGEPMETTKPAIPRSKFSECPCEPFCHGMR